MVEEKKEVGIRSKENIVISQDTKKKKILFIVLLLIFIVLVVIFGIVFFGEKEEKINLEKLQECLDTFYEEGHHRSFVEAVINKNVSLCNLELSELQQNCKDEYYFYSTLLDNINRCSNIKNTTFKDGCIMIHESKNECSGLKDPDNIICDAAFGISLEKCNEIENIEVKEYCESIYQIINALRLNDRNICQEIKSEDNRISCLVLIGEKLSDNEKLEYCQKRIG